MAPVPPPQTPRPGPLARRALRVPGRLYDWHLGWLLGHRFLRLTHVGRRSGRRYRAMLEVIGSDRHTDEWLVLASRGRRTDWYRNLLAQPAVEVAIGSRRFSPEHRILDRDEGAAAIEAFERRNRMAMPVVRRVLSWLVGWPYDGTPAARLRLAAQLPVVALRPATPEQSTGRQSVCSRVERAGQCGAWPRDVRSD